MSPDPDHVQVLAVSLHTVDCLPGSMPYARYSPAHHRQHERRASQLLAALLNAGYVLATTEGAR